MLVKKYISGLSEELNSIYDNREANNIANYVVEELFGKLFIKTNHILEPSRIEQLNDIKKRLLNYEPVQYILGEAWFYGLKFKVDRFVLIPRPETEELVELIIKENSINAPIILDIGTGSGCIPIIIKKEIPTAEVYTFDISPDAIGIAQQNAISHQTNIQIFEGDILHFNEIKFKLPEFDIIVSNPPYVNPSDKNSLHKNILDFEPHLALFEKENDAFIFYKKILEFTISQLKPQGKLYFEIPENKGDVIINLISGYAFNEIKIINDMQGKERIVTAVKI